MKKNKNWERVHQDCLHLLIGLERIQHTYEQLKSLPQPKDALSEVYLDAAILMQSYFINAQAINEKINSVDGNLLPELSETANSLVIIAKAIRNIVAHEGLWIPTFYSGVHHIRGRFHYFGIEAEKIKSSLSELYSKRKSVKPQEEERLRHAIELICEIEESGVVILMDLIQQHTYEVIPRIIKPIKTLLVKPEIIELENYLHQKKLITLGERIKRVEYSSACSKIHKR